MSPVEALTQIRALCDKLARENAYAEDGVFAGVMHTVSRVRAVLDAVSVDATPTQGIILTPDEAAACAWAVRRIAHRDGEGGGRARDGAYVGFDDLITRLEASS